MPEFYERQDVTYSVAISQHYKKKFRHHTLEESYEVYCKQCFENSDVQVHIMIFRKVLTSTSLLNSKDTKM